MPLLQIPHLIMDPADPPPLPVPDPVADPTPAPGSGDRLPTSVQQPQAETETSLNTQPTVDMAETIPTPGIPGNAEEPLTDAGQSVEEVPPSGDTPLEEGVSQGEVEPLVDEGNMQEPLEPPLGNAPDPQPMVEDKPVELQPLPMLTDDPPPTGELLVSDVSMTLSQTDSESTVTEPLSSVTSPTLSSAPSSVAPDPASVLDPSTPAPQTQPPVYTPQIPGGVATAGTASVSLLNATKCTPPKRGPGRPRKDGQSPMPRKNKQ